MNAQVFHGLDVEHVIAMRAVHLLHRAVKLANLGAVNLVHRHRERKRRCGSCRIVALVELVQRRGIHGPGFDHGQMAVKVTKAVQPRRTRAGPKTPFADECSVVACIAQQWNETGLVQIEFLLVLPLGIAANEIGAHLPCKDD